MSLSPFLDAAPVIQFHAMAALEALLLGPFVLYRRRRDRLHKVIGYVWVTSMALAALSSFFIHTLPMFGPFSAIHVLSVVTLVSLVLAVRAARAGRIEAHRRILRWLYWGGLGVATLFTMLPGRIMHRVVFGSDADALLLPMLMLGVVLVAGLIRWQKPSGLRRA
jgi:uncharacterized membrane protein